MATSSKPYDLEITIVSAKHLKNVNWRNGILKPYCIFSVDADRRLATKSDDSGSTQPVWNEKFVLNLPSPPQDSVLSLEIFHSKPSETPKPLVGTLILQLRDILDFDRSVSHPQLKTFELRRPSGRPHGKIKLKLALLLRPHFNYQFTPPPPLAPSPHNYYYSSAPPPPPPSSVRDYPLYSPISSQSSLDNLPPAFPSPPPPHPYQYGGSGGGGGYGDGYSRYYQGYYPQHAPPPPPPRPMFERPSSYGGPGPSAPVDYMSYDHKRGGEKAGWGTGLGVGAVAGALGGLALDEGRKYEEDKISERVESDGVAKEAYGNYRVDY